MTDLTNLNQFPSEPTTPTHIQGILAQIDLDIANLLRDGKLAAAPSTVGGVAGFSVDRAANLQSLLAARAHYQQLLDQLNQQLSNQMASWEISVGHTL